MVNLYAEKVETKEGKEMGALYGAPGLDLLATIGAGPFRGGIVAAGSAYIVSGNTVYSVTTSFVGTSLGTIGTANGPVSMIASNTQVLISDGLVGYLVTIATGALTTVASFPANANMLAYQDGFGLCNISGSNQFNQSNLNDLGTWNALNFSTANGQAGNTQTLVDANRELWVLCDANTEVWINAGLSGFAFQRLSGVFMEMGCIAPSSAIHNVDQSIMWLGQSGNGTGVAYRAQGYVPKRISTHAVERIWKTYPKISDAIGYSYQQEGHTFYMLVFPSGDATWAYDTDTGYWHERAALGADGYFHRHWSNGHFAFSGKNVVGDYRNGNLYAFNLGTFTDNLAARKWLRTWRAFPPGKEATTPTRFNALQVDCQTGINVPAGTNPQVTLRFSNDGGWTWSPEKYAKFGKTGETTARVRWNRLGATRRNGGLDRVWEISSIDPCPAALVGADMDAEPN